MEQPVVFLSVHEQWVDAILSGEKQYEYRKQPPAIPPPYRLLLYATRGPSEVRGEAVVAETVNGSIEDVLTETIAETPHKTEDIRGYFEGKTEATALGLSSVTPYETPITRPEIEQAIPDFTPPQNFRYVSETEYKSLRANL